MRSGLTSRLGLAGLDLQVCLLWIRSSADCSTPTGQIQVRLRRLPRARHPRTGTSRVLAHQPASRPMVLVAGCTMVARLRCQAGARLVCSLQGQELQFPKAPESLA